MKADKRTSRILSGVTVQSSTKKIELMACCRYAVLPLTGKCPVSPALEDGVKGRNIKGKYLTGKPRPLGRGASL